MPGKRSKSKKTSGLETFSKSQNIYKLLEKGIIESEALSSNTTDRPGQEDHIADLLESAESEKEYSRPARRARTGARTAVRKSAKSKAHKKRKR